MIKITRREELNEIFKDIDDNERKLISKLLDEIMFLEEQMINLKKVPFISINPKNSNLQKVTSAAKIYKECSQSYMNAVRILLNTLRKVESSAQDELLRRLEEFS